MQERGRRIHVVNLRKSGKFPSLCTTLEIFEGGHVVLQKNVKKCVAVETAFMDLYGVR